MPYLSFVSTVLRDDFSCDSDLKLNCDTRLLVSHETALRDDRQCLGRCTSNVQPY